MVLMSNHQILYQQIRTQEPPVLQLQQDQRIRKPSTTRAWTSSTASQTLRRRIRPKLSRPATLSDPQTLEEKIMRHLAHLQIAEVDIEVVVEAIREVAEAGMTMAEDIREEAEAAMKEISVVALEDMKAAMAAVVATKEISQTVEADMMEAQEDEEVMMAASVAVKATRAVTEVVAASKEGMEVVAASEVVEDIKAADMAAEVVTSSHMKEAITEAVVEEATLEEMDSMVSHLEQHRKTDQETSIMSSVEEEAASLSEVVSPTSNGNTKNPRARLTISELKVCFI